MHERLCPECGALVAEGEFLCSECKSRKTHARPSVDSAASDPKPTAKKSRLVWSIGIMLGAFMMFFAIIFWMNTSAARRAHSEEVKRIVDNLNQQAHRTGRAATNQVSQGPSLDGSFVSDDVERDDSGNIRNTRCVLRLAPDSTFEHLGQGRTKSFSGRYQWDGSGTIIFYTSAYSQPLRAQYFNNQNNYGSQFGQGIQLFTNRPNYIPESQSAQMDADDARMNAEAARGNSANPPPQSAVRGGATTSQGVTWVCIYCGHTEVRNAADGPPTEDAAPTDLALQERYGLYQCVSGRSKHQWVKR